jgi:FMN-dependent NADH-azoreductase
MVAGQKVTNTNNGAMEILQRLKAAVIVNEAGLYKTGDPIMRSAIITLGY